MKLVSVRALMILWSLTFVTPTSAKSVLSGDRTWIDTIVTAQVNAAVKSHHDATTPIGPGRYTKNTSTVPQIVTAVYEYLQSHLVTGTRWGYPYHFYKPSAGKYGSSQWLWDSGSHMISWSHKNVTNSILDLRTMLQMQKANGFIPEEIFWFPDNNDSQIVNWLYYGNEQQSNNTQMPVLAFSLRAIYEASNKSSAVLNEFLSPLVSYWDWWWATRNVGPHGLVSILHGWESGLDASPLYDAPYQVPNPQPTLLQMYPKFVELIMSYHFEFDWNTTEILNRANDSEAWFSELVDDWFVVEDIGVNAVYAAGWGVLGDLAREINNTDLARRCHAMEQELTNNILSYSWNASLGRFVSFYKTQEGIWAPIVTETVQSVMVLLLRDLPSSIRDSIVYGQLLNASKFGLPYPVPSVSVSEPSFNPVFTIDLMWRGPTWAFPTWFIMEGLQRHGYMSELNEMMDKWISMVQIGGIYEMYNPYNATPYGQEGLGMSCLIVDWLYRLGRVPNTVSN